MRGPIGFLDVVRSFLIVAVSLLSLVPAHSRAESNVQERVMNGQTVQSERDEQQALFDYYFREHSWKYETQLDALSIEASVPKWRIPYSAAIHPETQGGLGNGRSARPARIGIFRRLRSRPFAQTSGGSSVLNVYDRAFNGGQDRANSYEVRRIAGPGPQRGLFAAFRTRSSSESWEGYCSGFTGSTIRHPEPVKPVDAGTIGGTPGVVFQPSDIKALLSCIYNRTIPDSYLYLASPSARTGGPNMGTFHLALANYVGQAGCPIGIDRTKGQVSWNNPIYAYNVNSISDAGSSGDLHLKNVETTIVYTYYGSDNQRQTNANGDRVGNRRQSMTLKYTLELDANGDIVGGRPRTGAGHFLWIPLYAVQARPDGSAPGNPHVDVRTVIALARASAIPQVQEKFDKAIIGPMIDPSLESDESATDEAVDDS